MSLIANKSNPHLSPTLPYLVTTPTSTCYYASTYLPLFSTQPATTQAPIWHYSQLNLLLRQHLPVTTQVQTCKHLSHSLFSTHAFQAPRTCLSTYENMLFLPIEHALLAPWRGPSPTHLITFWFHVVYELHNRRYYSSLLRELEANQCNDFLLVHCISSFKDFTSSDSSNVLCSLWEKVLPSESHRPYLIERVRSLSHREHRRTEYTGLHRDIKSTDFTEPYSRLWQ